MSALDIDLPWADRLVSLIPTSPAINLHPIPAHRAPSGRRSAPSHFTLSPL